MTAETPAYKRYKAEADKAGRGDSADTTSAAWYGIAVMMHEVLNRLGPKPTREAFGPAVESLTSYSNGVIGATMGKGVHAGRPLVFPVTCCTGDSFTALGAPTYGF